MSQWGNERTFVGEDATIRVVSHVTTNVCWDPASHGDNVDSLVLIDIQGNREAAERMFSELCARHVGHPYKNWLL